MDLELTEDQQAIIASVARMCSDFGDDYWRGCDRDGRFPEEFVDAVVKGGWLGIAMPEAYGGSGLGILEAALFAHTVSGSGAGMSGASAVHINLFGPQPIVVFGSDAQKERFLPSLIRGEDRACFGVTEPDSGLNTSAITTHAERSGDRYLINGSKTWTS